MSDLFESGLKTKIENFLKKEITLVITDNTSSMVSIRMTPKGYVFRLHYMFLDADDSIIADLARMALGHRSSSIKSFIDENIGLIRVRSPRRVICRTRGFVYELSGLFNALNAQYFNGILKSSITWGRRTRRKRRSSILFGNYCRSRDLIRINPSLDNKKIPLFFVEHVIHHEMVHAYLADNGGKHSRAFKEEERKYEHYEKAILWQKAHLSLFIG